MKDCLKDEPDPKNPFKLTDEYACYYDFKKRVLHQAQIDLTEQSGASFTFTEQKKGREIMAIEFHFKVLL